MVGKNERKHGCLNSNFIQIKVNYHIIKIKILAPLLALNSIGVSDNKILYDAFVVNHLLLTKSKMQSSPTLWQEFREGHLRNFTVRYVDLILDSLYSGEISSYTASIRHFRKIDSLRAEVYSGLDYTYNMQKKIKKKYNFNYFHSSND